MVYRLLNSVGIIARWKGAGSAKFASEAPELESLQTGSQKVLHKVASYCHLPQARIVMRPLVLAAMLLTSFSAQACDLSLVAPAESALKKPVQVKASLAGGIMTTTYSVTAPSLNATKVFGPGQYPYMFDVVELFVTFSETGYPYFEFEVSPYNQNFQVRILTHTQHQEGVDLGLVSTATIRPVSGWDAELKTPLNPLGWDGHPKKIRGNFYSILGRGSTRSYWSTFLPRAKHADFHQPQFFQTLLQCG
jgi:hypothetical protein